MNIDWSFQQQTEHIPVSGHSGWARAKTGPSTLLKVRWQFKQRLIKTGNGLEVMCDAEVWAPLTTHFKVDDRFRYEGKLYQIVSVGRPVSIYGESGYWKIYCGAVAQ